MEIIDANIEFALVRETDFHRQKNSSRTHKNAVAILCII